MQNNDGGNQAIRFNSDLAALKKGYLKMFFEGYRALRDGRVPCSREAR